jgi:hypothetical protein
MSESQAVKDHSFYYIGSADGHKYPNLQVGDEVNPRLDFIFPGIEYQGFLAI